MVLLLLPLMMMMMVVVMMMMIMVVVGVGVKGGVDGDGISKQLGSLLIHSCRFLDLQLVTKITEVQLSQYLKRVEAQKVDFPGSSEAPPIKGRKPVPEFAWGQSTSCRAKQLRRRGQRHEIISDEEVVALLSEC